jgi:hypothetical protein
MIEMNIVIKEKGSGKLGKCGNIKVGISEFRSGNHMAHQNSVLLKIKAVETK